MKKQILDVLIKPWKRVVIGKRALSLGLALLVFLAHRSHAQEVTLAQACILVDGTGNPNLSAVYSTNSGFTISGLCGSSPVGVYRETSPRALDEAHNYCDVTWSSSSAACYVLNHGCGRLFTNLVATECPLDDYAVPFGLALGAVGVLYLRRQWGFV